MLVIRFFRVGKKNQPSFKIVVTDKTKPPRSGRFVEEVGFYNPLTKEKILKQDRIKYWLSVGAKPSDTVFNLLVSEKIIEGKKIPVHKKSPKESPNGDPTGQAKKEPEQAPATQAPAVKAQAVEAQAAETPTPEKPVKTEPVKETPKDKEQAKEAPKEETKTE